MEKPFRVWMCLCSYVLNEPCSTMIFVSKLDKDLGPDYGMKRGKSANPDPRSMWNGEHLVCYQVVDWSYESCQHHSLPTTFCHTGLKMNLQHYIACIITCFVSVWSVYVFLFSLFWMVCVEAFWIVNACKRHCDSLCVLLLWPISMTFFRPCHAMLHCRCSRSIYSTGPVP